MKTEICMKRQCKNRKKYNQCFKNEIEVEKQVVMWQGANTMKNSSKQKKKI